MHDIHPDHADQAESREILADTVAPDDALTAALFPDGVSVQSDMARQAEGELALTPPPARLKLSGEQRSILDRACEADGAPSSLGRIFGLLRASAEGDGPDVRPVVNAWNRRPEGSAAWNPSEWDLEISIPVGPAENAARTAVSEVLADTLIGGICALAPCLSGQGDSFAAAEQVIMTALEPESLVFLAINLATRTAVAHAGLGLLAPLAGNYAEALCRVMFPPDDHKIIDSVLPGLDIATCAEQGDQTAPVAFRAIATGQLVGKIEELLGSGPSSLQGVSAPEKVPAPEQPGGSTARSGLVAELWQRAKAAPLGPDGKPDRERADYLWLIVLIDPGFARECQCELQQTGESESESYKTITMLLAGRDRRFRLGASLVRPPAGAGTGR